VVGQVISGCRWIKADGRVKVHHVDPNWGLEETSNSAEWLTEASDTTSSSKLCPPASGLRPPTPSLAVSSKGDFLSS
jgi:hypothetical protein